MNPQLAAILKKQRSIDRKKLELNQLKTRVQDLKNPDPKVLKMIEDELINLSKETLVP